MAEMMSVYLAIIIATFLVTSIVWGIAWYLKWMRSKQGPEDFEEVEAVSRKKTPKKNRPADYPVLPGEERANVQTEVPVTARTETENQLMKPIEEEPQTDKIVPEQPEEEQDSERLETENDPSPAGVNMIRSATLVGKSAAWAKRAKDAVAAKHAAEGAAGENGAAATPNADNQA